MHPTLFVFHQPIQTLAEWLWAIRLVLRGMPRFKMPRNFGSEFNQAVPILLVCRSLAQLTKLGVEPRFHDLKCKQAEKDRNPEFPVF
jgi:hypothetical protein